jgi:glycosyltransferase involved in cell wall biosynthesis
MNNSETKDKLSLWREDGSRLIPQNFEIFHNLIAQAKDLLQQGQYDAAAVYGQIAANYAQLNHCGFFVSTELDELLLKIGRAAIPPNFVAAKGIDLSQNPQKILHVSTRLGAVGGIPRLMWRWIQQDRTRSHSVALTRQAPSEVPANLIDAVFNSHGKIHILNDRSDGTISCARRLRECAQDADLIVLHTWEYDVVPTIAFANQEKVPPIIYTNHGDHWFWVGAGIADVVANLRESGMRLAQTRRGIEVKRNLLLPTILEPFDRVLSRTEAKQQLGIDRNSVMLLSIARSVKYKTIDGVSFAEAHIPLLKKYPQAILVTIGAGDSQEDWSAAIDLAQGRIKILKETNDTSVYYQAADIYVDSFPFSSITSILEAGGYGVPAVSRYPYSSDTCEILGADMPGLTGNLIRVQDLEEYTTVLSRLVENEKFRVSLGEATRAKIAATHWGDNWQNALNDIYFQAMRLPKVSATSANLSEMCICEPDVFLPSVNNTNITTVVNWHLSLIPLGQRLRLWTSLVKKYGFRNNPLNSLLPEKFRARYYSFRLRLFAALKS